jgi:hypothetical protein
MGTCVRAMSSLAQQAFRCANALARDDVAQQNPDVSERGLHTCAQEGGGAIGQVNGWDSNQSTLTSSPSNTTSRPSPTL